MFLPPGKSSLSGKIAVRVWWRRLVCQLEVFQFCASSSLLAGVENFPRLLGFFTNGFMACLLYQLSDILYQESITKDSGLNFRPQLEQGFKFIV